MNRKGKIKLVIILSALYFIIFYSNNDIKMNMWKISNNEKLIAQLLDKQALLEEKLKYQAAEYELYNNDVDDYIELINEQAIVAKQIKDMKNQIADYQSKIEDLNNILKDN